MDKLKKYFIYILLLVGFFILSNFLINVGLNSTYKKITRKEDNLSQVVIYQEEATFVNGRIKGTIKNSDKDYLTGKYLKIDLYSKRNVLVGKKYIDITTTQNNTTQDFSMYFELKDVTSYEVSIVDHKEEGEIELIPKEMTKPEIIVLTAITLLIFW